MRTLIAVPALLASAALLSAREPWPPAPHPSDAAKQHVESITAGKRTYVVVQGGTMDGTNCRTPVGGGFGIWSRTWESNRSVRLENVGDTDVINPWLSNGRNNFRSVQEIVASAVKPGMSDREKAIALWRLQTTHRFHAGAGTSEMSDPVKVLNVYGYTTCGDDSICLAALWRTAGFRVRPARCVGHCISQVWFDGRWNLLDGDMGPFYLMRDNRTIAGERDLVRDHDLLRRAHTSGILDPDSRAVSEGFAALFVADADWEGTRDGVRNTTMNMTLRPGEAIVWSWGRLSPVKYHGTQDINLWSARAGADAIDRICNGRWEYRPDFSRELWRKGAESVEGVRSERGGPVAEAGGGRIVWRMRSPYVFVGGRLEVDGVGAKFSISFDGKTWEDVGHNLDPQFPTKGPARYDYRLRCELPAGARLGRLAVINDVQMAPLVLPGMTVGRNEFTYADQSPAGRSVKITHEWVERSLSTPPSAPAAPVSPADGGRSDGTDIAFEWKPAEAAGDRIVDHHFELADRADMAWPLSSNFEKLISNTADRGTARYRLTSAGLLTPGTTYYWRVRARNSRGVWGPWSKTWSFTADGPAPPVDVRLEPAPDGDGRLLLRWKADSIGRPPVKYRVYGSDEQGFMTADAPYKANIGKSTDLPATFPANFAAETTGTELVVVGVGVDLPNANKAFYRVVAVDERGRRSGPSEFAATPRPLPYSTPASVAKVGAAYRSQVSTIRSLGDLRMRIVQGRETASYWDIEKPRFALKQAPAWLRIDEATGVLTGTPDAAGRFDVQVEVSLERTVRRLDDVRLSWGQESVKETITERTGGVMQRFRITVER